MNRLEALLGRPLSALILLGSVVPFMLIVPRMIESRQLYDRIHNSAPLAAPRVVLSPAQARRFRPVPPYRGAVPVLAYRGIGTRGDDHAVTRRLFAEQMAALHAMDFHTITAAQYARFRRGEVRGLPSRPILITFDDARLDSYRGADRTLARHGFHATMFVVAGAIRRGSTTHLTWKELHRMRDSGRWDVEPQAFDGQRKVAYDRAGHTAPFYAVRRYTRSDGLESFADYEQRVTTDVFAARQRLIDQGFDPVAFAVPYGDYGQRSANDPAIPPFMRGLLTRQFGVYFVRDPRNDPPYTTVRDEAKRLEVHARTTTDRLYMWLRDHAPQPRPAA